MNRIGGKREVEDSAAAELLLSCSLTWFHSQNNAVVERIHSLKFLFLSIVRALLLLNRLSAC